MDRRPPAKVEGRSGAMPLPVTTPALPPPPESREARPIRLKPSEVEELKREAKLRGIGWTTFARECLLTGLSVEQAQARRQSHSRITA